MAGLTFTDTHAIALDIDTSELKLILDGLGEIGDVIDRDSLKDFGETLRAYAMARTPVGWRYDTSSHKWRESPSVVSDYLKSERSWSRVHATRTSVSFTLDSPYAEIVERGGYPSPGGSPPKAKPWAKGWRVSGGFSKQAPGGIIGPMIEDKESKLPSAKGATFKNALEEFEKIVTINFWRLLNSKNKGT